MAYYKLWLTDDTGRRIKNNRGETVLAPFGFTATKVVGQIGAFTTTLPIGFDLNLFKKDRMVQVWRAHPGGSLSLWEVYFLTGISFAVDRNNYEKIVIEGECPNVLLRRRIVATYSGADEASASTQADSMMREIVTDSQSDIISPVPAAGSRTWANFTVPSSPGNGPSVEKEFAWRRLLESGGGGIIGDISKASRAADNEVFFKVVVDTLTANSIAFKFMTYTSQPGRDRTNIIFSRDAGNLLTPKLEYDYSEEINYVYAGGQGKEDDRAIQQVYDETRFNLSAWNRCEGFVDARNEKTDNGVRDTGRMALEEGRLRRRFTGIPVDTENTIFGRDWDWGDRVTAKYLGQAFECIIRSVALKVDVDGNETIDTKLEYEN